MSSPSDEATIGEKKELVYPGQGTPPDEFEKINVDTPLPELEIRVKMTGLDGAHVSWLLGKVLSVVLSPVSDDRRPGNTAIAFAGELKPVTAKSFYLSQAPRPCPSRFVSALIRSPIERSEIEGPGVLLELAGRSDGAGCLRESILIWTFFHVFLLLPSYLSQELLDFRLRDGTVGGKPRRIAEG